MRDAKGNPHATIEVKPGSEKNVSDIPSNIIDDYVNQGRPGNFPDWVKSNYPDLMEKNPPSIHQVKGMNDRIPKEEYLPYVQDFVRSGKWSDVKDFHHTGLMRKSDYIDEFTPSQLDSIGSGEYVTKQELDSLRLPPEGGMRRGGKVRKPISLDAMRLAVGGSLVGEVAKRAAKLVVSMVVLRAELTAALRDVKKAELLVVKTVLKTVAL